MARPAKNTAEKMIKVNHAGENGAVNIYRAQKMISTFRSSHLVPQLKQQQLHEEAHRHIFYDYLVNNGGRRCVSYHLCGIGGYVLGFITGLLGQNAIAATTFAVEKVVLSHLEKQLTYLKNTHTEAYGCVSSIVADEKAHHDAAEQQLRKEGFLEQTIIQIVSLSTRAVIRFGMR